MSRTANRTKVHILRAAIELFSVQGFGSTSIREIAEAAKVNAALVSYHFKNKQGVLESIMVDYFEKLFFELEADQSGQAEDRDSFADLMRVVDIVIGYQCKNLEVSRIIQRELSVDSMLIREVMSTYIAKLKANFSLHLERGIEAGQFRQDLEVDMQIIHMMSSIFFPYFNPQIIREVFYVEPLDDNYREEYVRYLSKIWFSQLKNDEIC
ncbi:forespore capture DNA-binding protein RefZ [Ammoniphilus sp. CFH 90114]|uniref:forespore capture DNA-binding protein RefZ n=1 Tax=Ammoniphilus sp. CFH 90114 TaxID=2493665 RepID=UPI0013E90DC8|nr:forespore capture DNA-binding protein RefZ [Ammoniphilus sp. CFH 90114]